MGVCAVYDCNNNTRKKTRDSSFHKFPKGNLNLSKNWTLFCKRKDKINIQTARICSLHFLKEDFENNVKYEMGFTPFRILKADAVPTVYPKKQSKDFEPDSTKRSKRKDFRKKKELINELLEAPVESEIVNMTEDQDECENLRESIPYSVFQFERAQLDESTEQVTKTQTLKESNFDCQEQSMDVLSLNTDRLHASTAPALDPLRLPPTIELRYQSSIKNKCNTDRDTKTQTLFSRRSTQTGHTYTDIQLLKTKEILRLKRNDWRQRQLLKTVGNIFTKGQLKKMECPLKRMQWSEEDFSNALAIYAAGPRAYELLLERGFPFPSVFTLKKLLQKLKQQKMSSLPK